MCVGARRRWEELNWPNNVGMIILEWELKIEIEDNIGICVGLIGNYWFLIGDVGLVGTIIRGKMAVMSQYYLL